MWEEKLKIKHWRTGLIDGLKVGDMVGARVGERVLVSRKCNVRYTHDLKFRRVINSI